MTIRGETPTRYSESSISKRRLSPILANYEKVKKHATDFEQRLFMDELPVDALFGPNTANIPRRHLKYFDETRPISKEGSTTTKGVPCVYLVTRKPGRKKKKKSEQEVAEKSRGALELKRMIKEVQRETLNWSSSSLECDEEEEEAEDRSEASSMQVKTFRSAHYAGQTPTDKNHQRSIKIFTSRKEADRIKATMSRIQRQPESETKKQQRSLSRADSSRSIRRDEGIMNSVKLKWDPSMLLTLFEKVGLRPLTEKTEEKIKISLKRIERESKKYCEELSSDTDDGDGEYSIIKKEKKKPPIEQLKPPSEFLTKFSKIVEKKDGDGAGLTRIMIDEVIFTFYLNSSRRKIL